MFEKIYEAAIKQDQSALQQAIFTNCIDEHKKGRYCLSASAQLAYENNITAVEFLLKNGANLNYAAMGAAMGKHREYAEELMGRGASPCHVGWGAGFSGDKNYIFELMTSRSISIDRVAHGAATGGHLELAEELIQQGAEITSVAAGAAIGGYLNYADNLIKRGAKIHEVAFSAAIVGNKEYAEKLIQQDVDYVDIISYVAEGAAMGGHQDYAQELIQRGAYIDWVASGASKGGHREYLETLIRPNLDLTQTAYGAGFFGHRGLTENLIYRGGISDAVAKGSYQGSQVRNDQMFIAYLSFYQPELISILINDYRKNWIDIDDMTLKKIIAISKHMHINKLSYEEALVRIDQRCQGMLYMLMMLTVTNNTLLLTRHLYPGKSGNSFSILSLRLPLINIILKC